MSTTWRTCKGCDRVLALTEFDEDATVCRECETAGRKPRRQRPPGASSASVAAYRARTGNAYGKAYAKARAAAVNELIGAHPEEFASFLEKARIDVGLGPTRT